MGNYNVIRTTTDHLATNLNAEKHDGRMVHTVQWIGGRDWVIIERPADDPPPECPGGKCTHDDAGCGWVADRDRRHRRFDEAEGNYGGVAGLDLKAMLVDPETEFGNIRYGRYDEHKIKGFTGWIEDVARTWIIFLGPHGAPALYWPRRDEGGGVIGEPIDLRA